MTHATLVKIDRGCYRTEDGGYVIFQSPNGGGWIVSYTNFFGIKERREFRTLAECRRFINLYR